MNVMSAMLASAPTEPSDSSRVPTPRRVWQLGPNVPQTRSTLLRAFGYRMMRLLGWDFEGQMPNLSRFVVIVAPHTSNLDFFIGLFGKWALGVDIRFLAKSSVFVPPVGWFMRAIGGVPVVRTQRNNIVEQSIHEFATRQAFVLVLAPEGTRKRVREWKSGFWHIARAARVPICCVALDFGRKRIRLGPVLDADDVDAATGVARARAQFADVNGRHPSRQ
jgi:1-acyl-sn-glycerol-3-phosphate acyltransferase